MPGKLDKPRISFFFPVRNEEDTVEEHARRADKTLRELASEYEVIIIDNASTDRTSEIADRLAKENRCIRVVRHNGNKGYGHALRSGFSAAAYDYILYVDGDLQFDVAELSKMIPLVEDAAIVSAYRIRSMDGLIQNIASWIYNTSLKIFFGLRVIDVNCGFKLYRREVFDRITLNSTSRLTNAEILLKAKRAGFRIVQTGVTHYRRSSGRSRDSVRDIVMTKFQMIKLWRELHLP